MEPIGIHRFAQAQETIGIEFEWLRVDLRVVVNSVSRELKDSAGWDVEPILERVGFLGIALRGDWPSR